MFHSIHNKQSDGCILFPEMVPENIWSSGIEQLEKITKWKKTGLKGFEPLTCGLRVRRYAELSYRPKPVRPSNVVDNGE